MSGPNNSGIFRRAKLILSAGLDTLRRDGVITFLTETVQFIKRGGEFDTYSDTRIDNEERWQLIEPYLDGDDKLALDIGCAEGFFTRKLAEHGVYTIGIDKRGSVDSAEAKTGENLNLEYKRMTVTPDNVGKLPRSDITLFLTVIHWWHRSFGAEESESMLRTLASKTDLLVFEPPESPLGTLTISQSETLESENFWMKYLINVLDDSVEVEYLGKTEYMNKDREDPLYVVDTSHFSRSNNP